MWKIKGNIMVVILLLVAFSYNVTFAQNPSASAPEPKTKLESFERQSGTVVIKGYSEIGKVTGLGSVTVDCMEFTNATTGQRQTGIVIDVIESGRLERSDRSFIDYDEIQPLLKGIDYINTITSKNTRLSSFEAVYKTKGDFQVITFSSSGKVEAAVRSGYIGPATAYLTLQQLGQLRELISKAKKTLDSIK